MATSSQGEAFHRVVLQALKAHKNSIDQTPEQEIEEKFVRLSLAFKTDKLTLNKRVELHQRARDVAEQNIEEQLASVKEALKVLGPLCKDAKTREVFSKIEHHVDVLGSSTARMSSRAEILGAVKQEYRISEAIDVMIQHVENLKQSLEREHAELEEAKGMLMESRHVVEADAILHRKSLSITSHGSKVGRRRASVAVLPKTPVLPPTGTKNTNATTDDLDTKNKLETSTSSPTLCTLSLPLVLDWIPKPAPVHRPSTEHSARESLSPSNSQSTKYNNSIEQGTKTERCEANIWKGKMQHTADLQLHLVNGNGGHHDDDNVKLSDDELEIADEIFPDLQNLLNLFHYLATGLIILLGFCTLMAFIILEDTDDWFYLYFKYKPG